MCKALDIQIERHFGNVGSGGTVWLVNVKYLVLFHLTIAALSMCTTITIAIADILKGLKPIF